MNDGEGIESQRPRGFLTKSDRAWLRGEAEYESAQLRNRRRYVRTRLENAILDFALVSALSEKDLDLALRGLTPEEIEPFLRFAEYAHARAEFHDTHTDHDDQ